MGLKTPFTSKGSLYKTTPLAGSTTPLLKGSVPNQKSEVVAWVNNYKKAKVVYTSLGYREDFDNPQFELLMHNATRWCAGMRIGKE